MTELAWGALFGLAVGACLALLNELTGFQPSRSIIASLVTGSAVGAGLALFNWWLKREAPDE